MTTRRSAHPLSTGTAQWGGVLMLVLGSWLLYDAYEGRGRRRPWLTRLIPGA